MKTSKVDDLLEQLAAEYRAQPQTADLASRFREALSRAGLPGGYAVKGQAPRRFGENSPLKGLSQTAKRAKLLLDARANVIAAQAPLTNESLREAYLAIGGDDCSAAAFWDAKKYLIRHGWLTEGMLP